MKEFYTKEKSEQGIKLPLYFPGTNKKSEHWLHIIGTDSDVFRRKNVEMKRIAMDIEGLKPEEQVDAHLSAMRELVAALVIDWSFPQECNLKNVTEFLRNAPHIQEAVNAAAARRSLFFVNASENSANTPDASSD